MLAADGTTNTRDMEAVRMLITRTFMDALRQTEMQPMDALKCAATAIGLVYRDVAEAHLAPRFCPCGWEPDLSRDVELLQAALKGAALPELEAWAAAGPVIGHA